MPDWVGLETDVYGFVHNCLMGYGWPPYMAWRHREPDGPVYYAGPWWDQEEITAAVTCLLGGKWLSAGEEVRKFERAFSQKFDVQDSVMLNSGSSAGLVMLAAAKEHFGWEDGAGIAVCAASFPTTVAPIVQNRLTPVFVDAEPDTLNLSVWAVDQTPLTTKAVLLSPMLGNPPDTDAMMAAAVDRRGLVVLLDNCDSLGARWRGRYLTHYSVASSCSFYPAHHIAVGQGGMISGDRKLVDIARSLVNWGRACRCEGAGNLNPKGQCGKRFSPWLACTEAPVDHRHVYDRQGWNMAPMDLQGAIGLAQLAKFDEMHRRRRANKLRIGAAMAGTEGLRVIGEHRHAEAAWFAVPILCGDRRQRAALVSHMEARGVQTRGMFGGNLLAHPGYRHLGDWREYPNATEIMERGLFIGCSPTLDEAALEYVEKALREF